jgi:hypothetical protein
MVVSGSKPARQWLPHDHETSTEEASCRVRHLRRSHEEEAISGELVRIAVQGSDRGPRHDVHTGLNREQRRQAKRGHGKRKGP